VAIDDGEVFVSALNPDNGGEVKLLDKLNGTLAAYPNLKDATFVAHHADFDLRFIFQRAVVLGLVPLLPNWPTLSGLRLNDRVYDTMTRWAGYGNRISLDRLCVNLGLPGKSDVTGADVYDLWQAHKYREIARYNAGDVHRLRSVHRRMTGRAPLQIDIDALTAGIAVATMEAA
jgi:DNA polymerase III epsilon subunit-like protein